MLIAGHQPEYLPYIGFFNKMMLVDKFIIVDHVQFVKKSWQNRNRIRTSNGWIFLTVPVLTKGNFFQKIKEVKINNSFNWQRKHLKSILINYKNSPYFKDFKYFFEELYSKKWEYLSELNETIIKFIAKELKINVEILKSSNLEIEGLKTDLLIDLCKKLHADSYLSGEGGHNYVDETKFKENNLKHFFRVSEPITYRQQFKSFVPDMSIIDLLFNCDKDVTISLIKKSGKIDVNQKLK